MAADQLQALVAAVKTDPEVAQRFVKAQSVDEAVEVASELGYDVTAEELALAVQEVSSAELSEADLESVSGGGGQASVDPQFCSTATVVGYC